MPNGVAFATPWGRSGAKNIETRIAADSGQQLETIRRLGSDPNRTPAAILTELWWQNEPRVGKKNTITALAAVAPRRALRPQVVRLENVCLSLNDYHLASGLIEKAIEEAQRIKDGR